MSDDGSQGEFRWPPGLDAPAPNTMPDDAPAPGRAGIWDAFERTWLDPRAHSWQVRARLEGLRPEDPSQACPRCAASVGPWEADADGCPACRGTRLPWSHAIRLGVYDGALREAIHDLKFHRWRRTGRDLGRLLGERIARDRARLGLDRMTLTLVPVPTSTRRRLARGIDHTLVLSRSVARASGGRVVRALTRAHRPEQWAVPPSERGRNVAGAFRVRRRLGSGASHIVLVDDIRTTGATLRASARALVACWSREERARRVLWVATVGVSEGRERRSDPTQMRIACARGARETETHRKLPLGC